MTFSMGNVSVLSCRSATMPCPSPPNARDLSLLRSRYRGLVRRCQKMMGTSMQPTGLRLRPVSCLLSSMSPVQTTPSSNYLYLLQSTSRSSCDADSAMRFASAPPMFPALKIFTRKSITMSVKTSYWYMRSFNKEEFMQPELAPVYHSLQQAFGVNQDVTSLDRGSDFAWRGASVPASLPFTARPASHFVSWP